MRPELFHAVSLGLHVANVLVVDRLLGRLAAARWMAAAGAADFAVQPLQAESVAWISEQRGLLAALLSLRAVERFLRWLESPGVWNRFVRGGIPSMTPCRQPSISKQVGGHDSGRQARC